MRTLCKYINAALHQVNTKKFQNMPFDRKCHIPFRPSDQYTGHNEKSRAEKQVELQSEAKPLWQLL